MISCCSTLTVLGSPNRKRGATPPTDSLNLESSMPKVSGKAIDTFVNFAEEQRHQHKQVEIEDFKKFSQQLERVRYCSRALRSNWH